MECISQRDEGDSKLEASARNPGRVQVAGNGRDEGLPATKPGWHHPRPQFQSPCSRPRCGLHHQVLPHRPHTPAMSATLP